MSRGDDKTFRIEISFGLKAFSRVKVPSILRNPHEGRVVDNSQLEAKLGLLLRTRGNLSATELHKFL